MANTTNHPTKSATQKADEAALARKTQVTGEKDNAETKAAKSEEKTGDGERVTQPDDQPAGVDMRVGNPREPIPHVREGAKATTPARGADPVGTPGTAEPGPGSDPVESAKLKAEADTRVEHRKVIMKRKYWPLSGEAALDAVDPDKATPEDAVELPIEEARHLEESGIAQAVETYPFSKK